jgi:hypothetical protein
VKKFVENITKIRELNTMNKYLLCLFAFTIVFKTFGQKKNKEDIFSFIENTSDTSSLKAIQSISTNGHDLIALYWKIKKQAQDKGANCFKLKNFTLENSGEMSLTLDTYYGSDNFLLANHDNHQTNEVYIISDGDFSDKTYTFSINDEKKIIKSGTYYKAILEPGEKLKINKGGAFGSTVTLYWEENKFCKFFSTSGFGFANSPYGMNPAPSYGGGLGMSVSFSNGKLTPVDASIGFLLTKILTQQE